MELGKRVRDIVRVILFMIKKGVSKSKLLFDLSLLLKRGNKIATKAIHNLMFHHHHHGHHPNSPLYDQSSVAPPREYEFSCSNTPQYYQFLPWNGSSGSSKRRHGHGAANFFGCAFHEPKTEDDGATVTAVKLALEMLNNGGGGEAAVEASPYLPGFGRSPAVRQLRITDSPFPLREAEEDDNGYVDKKAEEFIQKFYKELKKQKKINC